MKKLSRETLTAEYNKYKGRAISAYNNLQFEDSLSYVEYCARLAQAYPIIYKFIDDELEELLNKISRKQVCVSEENEKHICQEKIRVVFYNGQIIDSGALTEQYLDFLIKNNIQTLVIIPDIKNTFQGQRILDVINTSSNVTLYIPSSGNRIERIEKIKTQIDLFKPSHSFLHFLPSDVIGYCVFANYSHFKRFYIVHNDHTFWLGKNCSDFFIEFRQFGHQIAVERRGINCEKILLVPYYPIHNNTPFQGFPFDRTGKVVGFSGANLYKYLLDPELKYFHAIKYLIVNNPNFIFCLAGYGDVSVIKKFIDDNQLHNRFFFLGRRHDFYNLIGNIDIYFESYPGKGGLSFLFATEQNIPVTGIASLRTASHTTSKFFDLNIRYVEPVDIASFIKDANALINSVEKRQERVALFQHLPNNKNEFQNRLNDVISGNYKILNRTYNDLLTYDDEIMLKEYLSISKSDLYFLIRKYQMLNKNIPFLQKIYLLLSIVLHKDFRFPPIKKAVKHLLSML